MDISSFRLRKTLPVFLLNFAHSLNSKEERAVVTYRGDIFHPPLEVSVSDDNIRPMIVETPTLESYFYELVTASVELLDSEISPQAQYYLVTLLNGFVERQNALGVDNDCLDEPLALMLKRSLEASGESQARHLKQLGDVALFVSGFYSDRIDR